MTTTPTDREKLIARGKELYQTKIRHLVEPQEKGKFLALDVATGDYAFAQSLGVATQELLERKPEAIIHSVRIGYPTVYRFHSLLKPSKTNP